MFPNSLGQIQEISLRYGVLNLRIFGSARKNWERARDCDLVALCRSELTLLEQAGLISELQDVVLKPVDLVLLTKQTPLVLASEIGSTSALIWESPDGGRESYAILIDQLMALAEDERLSFPIKLRIQSLSNQLKQIDVA